VTQEVEVAQQRNYDETRRRELADFLRRKREGLPPPIGGSFRRRRLTPGFRREEVAELAEVGTTWYTWLEQARDIRPSERTLRRIARGLQLSKIETQYLLDLALEHAPRQPARQVPHALLTILNAVNLQRSGLRPSPRQARVDGDRAGHAGGVDRRCRRPEALMRSSVTRRAARRCFAGGR
jgi:transcriptional regulator with XRE-family HTH domain